MRETDIPVLLGNESFPIRAVGTSYHRDAIAKIGLADGSDTQLYFLPLLLLPYDTNPHDPMAVAVLSLKTGEHLGHLPASDAIRYRARLSELAIVGGAICGGVIGGGRQADDEARYFWILVDVDLHKPIVLADSLPFDPPQLRPRMEWIQRIPRGLSILRCWMSEPASDLVSSWLVTRRQRPEWNFGAYYAERLQGGGYGLHLFGIDTSEELVLFGGYEVDGEMMEVEGRWGTVYLEGHVPGKLSHLRRWEGGRTVRKLFLLREQLVQERADIKRAVNPIDRIALALQAQETQYQLAEMANQAGEDGMVLREQAQVHWGVLTTPYIQIIVRGLVEAGDVDRARRELDRFCSHAPYQRGGKVILALNKNITAGKVNNSKRRT